MTAQDIVLELRAQPFGLTQQQIATHIGVTQGAISLIEKGTTKNVMSDKFVKLQDLLRRQRASAARKSKVSA